MCNKNNTCLISLAISLVLGVFIGIAFFFGLIPGIITVIFLSLVLAFVSIIGIILLDSKKKDKCLCKNGICTIIGTAGIIVTGFLSLGIILLPAIIPFAILIGVFGFFTVLTLVSWIFILLCLTKCEYYYYECEKQ